MCTLHAVVVLCFWDQYRPKSALSSWLVVLGDLVDVDAWGNVPCVSKIDTLGLL
jgi:uncharacterized membrane protein YqjE